VDSNSRTLTATCCSSAVLVHERRCQVGLLAAHDLENAHAAAEELSEIASAFDAPLLSAASAQATGAVLLARDNTDAASASLRQAWTTWRDLQMPYDEAQTCGVCTSWACRSSTR
jgi:hypothetical protein